MAELGQPWGLFTRAQARAAGLSGYQIRRRVSAGVWRPVVGPVLAWPWLELTVPVLDRAALMARPEAVAAVATAARLHRIPVPDARQYLVVPAGGRRAVPGIRMWREDLPASEVTVLSGVRVTSLPRTVFDCVRFLPDHDAVDLLNLALERRWTTWTDFTARLAGFVERPGQRRLAPLARSATRAEGCAGVSAGADEREVETSGSDDTGSTRSDGSGFGELGVEAPGSAAGGGFL